jgi:outer membrane protein TolC
VGFCFLTTAQAREIKYTDISLAQYLEIVRQNNAYIGSAALDIKTAEAIKEADSLYRIAPNVSYFRGGYTNQIPYSTYNTPQSSTYALSFTVEGWGKRDARKNLGQAKIGASAVQLEKNKNTIELNAINTYIDTLQLSLLIKSYSGALDKVKTLPSNSKTTDSENFLKNYKSYTEDSLVFYSQGMRNYSGDALKTLPLPTGNLNYPMQEFILEALIIEGQSKSVEVLELQAAIDVADKNITLTNKNRNIDFHPYISQSRMPAYQYTNGIDYSVSSSVYGSGTVISPGAAYSAQNTTTVGVTFPIPISNYFQSADIVSAANQKLQYEMKLRDLMVQIEVKVTQAFIEYGRTKITLQSAQRAYESALKSPNKTPLTAIMDLRDKEGTLIDAKASHLRSLVKLQHQSGNYSPPNF